MTGSSRFDDGIWHFMASLLPKGLYGRFLLIVILPILLLQSAIAYFFIERHGQQVTARLSNSIAQHIATVVDLSQTYKEPSDYVYLRKLAKERLELDIELLPKMPLPAPLPEPFFSILDKALTKQLSLRLDRPFWVDTISNARLVEVRIALDTALMRIVFYRAAATASNFQGFLVSMGVTSIILMGIALAFLRNQIRPIIRLARAAEALGKGRDPRFSPHGAREVRQAGYAFLEMKRRIERAIDQRTTMLNGVSHDIRTLLTRFQLSLALLGEGQEIEALQKDVAEMQAILEGYLAFVSGEVREEATYVNMPDMLQEFVENAKRQGFDLAVEWSGDPMVMLRPESFRRCLGNLISNAHRYGKHASLTCVRDQKWLTCHVEDDGPGIALEWREEAFRPFARLDAARNQDAGGSGLGLTIARDIARAHGGDITLNVSTMGGLRAIVRIPL